MRRSKLDPSAPIRTPGHPGIPGDTMPVDQDWQDDDRPRRSGLAAKSGVVTALGVVDIVFGSLVALPGLWLLLRGVFVARRPHPTGHGIIGASAVFDVVVGLIVLLIGVGFMMAGVGVVSRRPWGRI